MAQRKIESTSGSLPAPLSAEQLVASLHRLGFAEIDYNDYWDQHIEVFRQTVLLAVRETTDALEMRSIPPLWRIELESQLELLCRYIELADRYLELRTLNPRRSTSSSRRPRHSIH